MKKAIISLTFDDALDAHLDHAIPILNDYGLRGTFFVHLAADTIGRRGGEWVQAAATGHELGNHTIFHPGLAAKPWVGAGNAIDSYTPERMRLELAVANNILRMLDGRTERTYAFPCSYPLLGRTGWPKRALGQLGLDRTRLTGWLDRWHLDIGSRVMDYTPIVSEYFFAARCGGVGAFDHLSVPADRFRVPAVEGDGCDADRLLSWVDLAVERNAWIVFAFHGIGGGHGLSCSLASFRRLAERVQGDSRVAVKTFLDAAKAVWE